MSVYEYRNAMTRLRYLVREAWRGDGLTPVERAMLVGELRRQLGVPATIWSPEDFAGWAADDDHLDEIWESFDPEITESMWDQVANHATQFFRELQEDEIS